MIASMEIETMATASQQVIDKLANLTGIVEDSEEGYRTAASGTHDAGAKALFERYAEQRHQMAEELKGCLRTLGAEPPETGTVRGRAARLWTSVRSALSRDDALAMLEQCERNEDMTKHEFQEVLDTGVPVDLRPAIESMYTRVRETHDQVKNLRDQRRQAH